ncbi:MAG: hypothetical protein A2169_09225 [Deltaproteobacteria bacterium RBG_13_47_9]|nr:MAG: hypothetical protein A2169_09225 [Deltaproteobacteria bacterium RBG_13_47_9]
MIKIGTSGFSFPDWKGVVYPVGIRERDMLSFYEKELGFNALEVNFTYYTLPSPKSFVAMSQKTSKGFEFVVKSFKGMTHEIRDKETGKIVNNQETFKKFKDSLAPLIEDGKLTCVLAQFPYGFFPHRESLSYLERFKGEMEDIPLVFEFRNQTWVREQTFHFLEEKGVGFCIVDEPKLPKLMPYLPRATSEMGYFRFHGRNRNWFNVPTSVRYDYLYSEGELKEFLPDIRDISKKTVKTLVFFNNCHAGSAAKNAAQMARLLANSSEQSVRGSEMESSNSKL